MKSMTKNKVTFIIPGIVILMLFLISCRKEVGEIAKLDLSGAKYLFIKKSGSGSSLLNTQQDGNEGGILFKIKEDGTIEQVIVYDENGKIIKDVLVKYCVRVGTKFISIGLIISGEERRYLVRVSDGAVFSGDCALPDDYADKVLEDGAGNYYFKAMVGPDPYTLTSGVVKLDPVAMTTQVISAQDDYVYNFDVDKYGNLIYSTSVIYFTYRAASNGRIYRLYEGYSLEGTDINRDTIYLFDAYVERILKLTHPADSLKMDSVIISPPAIPYAGGREIIGKGNRVVLFLNTDVSIIRFIKVSLLDGSNDCDSVNLSGFSLVDYKMVSSDLIYVLLTSGQSPYKKYTFISVDIPTINYNSIYETTDFEIKSFWTDENGDIIANALNLNNGKSCVIKITPSGQMTIIEEGEDTISNLIRVG